MKDLPLLFSAPMILANLDGRKRQTRRVLRDQPPEGWRPNGWSTSGADDRRWRYWRNGEPGEIPFRVPFVKGDRLWIRESWRTTHVLDAVKPSALKATETSDVPYTPIKFEADGAVVDFDPHSDPRFGKLRPGIFLPRWASRLTAIVERVRVERLQDISQEDAIAEGIEPIRGHGWKAYGLTPKPFSGAAPGVLSHGRGVATSDPRHSYATLWESINGEGSWSLNPFVVAVSYRLEARNIDEVAA